MLGLVFAILGAGAAIAVAVALAVVPMDRGWSPNDQILVALVGATLAWIALVAGIQLFGRKPALVDARHCQAVSGDGGWFNFRYDFTPTENFYSPTSQAKLPLKKKTIYPGLKIDFLVVLNVPDAGKWDFKFSTIPAPDFSVGHAGWETEPNTRVVYDEMVRTSFRELETAMLKAYGLPGS